MRFWPLIMLATGAFLRQASSSVTFWQEVDVKMIFNFASSDRGFFDGKLEVLLKAKEVPGAPDSIIEP